MIATAAASKLATELGVDLEEIEEGTGKDGKITKPDVQAAARNQSLGEMPADITGRGISIWNEVKDYLENEDLWMPVFGHLLASYVRAVMTEASMRHAIDVGTKEKPATGSVGKGSQGQPVKHPNVTIRRDAELDALKYASALCITPEALKQHRNKAGGEDPDDPDEIGF